MRKVAEGGRTGVHAVTQDSVYEKDDLFMNWHSLSFVFADSKGSSWQSQVESHRNVKLNQLLKDAMQIVG